MIIMTNHIIALTARPSALAFACDTPYADFMVKKAMEGFFNGLSGKGV